MNQAHPACYIRALVQMCDDRSTENRRFARECLYDMGEPGVSVPDYLRPFMTRPLSELAGPERRLRLLATNHPLAGGAVQPEAPQQAA